MAVCRWVPTWFLCGLHGHPFTQAAGSAAAGAGPPQQCAGGFPRGLACACSSAV